MLEGADVEDDVVGAVVDRIERRVQVVGDRRIERVRMVERVHLLEAEREEERHVIDPALRRPRQVRPEESLALLGREIDLLAPDREESSAVGVGVLEVLQ